MHVAVDLLGGSDAPVDVALMVDGVARALDGDRDLRVTVVGAPGVPAPLHGYAARVTAVAADPLPPQPPPVRAVRAGRATAVRVAARLLRDGAVDAVVSPSLAGLAAAAEFVLGLLPGAAAPAAAVRVAGPTLLLDAGAAPLVGAARVAELSVLGAALARCWLQVPDPLVRPLGGDGGLTGADVVRGGVAHVAVGAGDTAAVLASALAASGAADAPMPVVGVAGIAVATGAAGDAAAVAAAVDTAAALAGAGLLEVVGHALSMHTERRRRAAGLVAAGRGGAR